ncbi:MAG: hypothetical protein H6834_11395 [Planctomycetes bacterium]|nr:hypothetical protein [Planctomycetota bacterium]
MRWLPHRLSFSTCAHDDTARFRTARPFVAIGFFLTCVPLHAQERFPLGPLGATGQVEAGSDAILVVDVQADGPAAKAGLKNAERIVAVSEQTFRKHTNDLMDGGRGPQKTLGEALDALREPHIVLTVADDAGTRSIEVVLPERPSFQRGRFKKSARASHELRAAAAQQLLAAQRDNGMWDAPVGLSGDRVTTAWALIALLAHGDPAHVEALARAATWLRGPQDHAWIPDDPMTKGPDNLGNWAIASTSIALAEHQRATKTDHASVIARCNTALAARMTKEGRFGHDIQVGYGGKGFNVINTLAHLAWASGAHAGVPLPEEAWEKSFEEIRASIDPNGGVRYWTMRGTGTGDASLRTGSMALALTLTGREPALAEQFATYLLKHAPRAREAHAVGSLGMLVSAPALWAHDHAAWKAFVEEWRWYLVLMRGPDDRVRYIGGKGNNGGDSYLGMDSMACIIALMLLACPDEHLALHHVAPRETRER